MSELTLLLLLAVLFFCIAYFSSSVGLGGGSCYTALLAASSMGPLTIPLISLSLNLIVTSAGSYHFLRNRHASWRLITPFLITSMPMAYLGGSLKLPKTLFYGILFTSLLIVLIRIFFCRQTALHWRLNQKQQLTLSLIIGAVLGFVAGVVGIGGGIYLVPLIILFGLGSEKQAAASGAIFIWLNSIIGLIARVRYHSVEILDYLPLLLAVALGAMLGSWLGATSLRPQTMQKILGSLILAAFCLLTRELLQTS